VSGSLRLSEHLSFFCFGFFGRFAPFSCGEVVFVLMVKQGGTKHTHTVLYFSGGFWFLDVLTLVQDVGEGWWEGQIGQKVGLFPQTYVELVADAGNESWDDDEQDAEEDWDAGAQAADGDVSGLGLFFGVSSRLPKHSNAPTHSRVRHVQEQLYPLTYTDMHVHAG
jgi:hypothetical protein